MAPSRAGLSDRGTILPWAVAFPGGARRPGYLHELPVSFVRVGAGCGILESTEPGELMRTPSALLVLVLAIASPASAGFDTLLRDDFDGSSLDTSKWFVPSGPGTFFGRTQIRPPSEALSVEDGVIRLQLDTHNRG